MLQIEDKNKFGKVIADALASVERNSKDAYTKKRWINAIAKAAAEIEQNGVFMTWQPEDHSLLIWSQKSDQIYTANGVCQCRAFAQSQACWHRSAARLFRLYLEPETVAVAVEPERIKSNGGADIPYLKTTVQIKAERVGGIRIN
jgi:hypothetical protein